MSLTLTSSIFIFFFFNDTATTEIYTLSLHDALPISKRMRGDSEPSASTAARTSSGSPASCFAKACRWGAGALKASAINGESVASTRAGIRHLLKPVWLRRRDGQGCASHLLGLAEQSVAVFLFDTSGNLIGRLLFAAK